VRKKLWTYHLIIILITLIIFLLNCILVAWYQEWEFSYSRFQVTQIFSLFRIWFTISWSFQRMTLFLLWAYLYQRHAYHEFFILKCILPMLVFSVLCSYLNTPHYLLCSLLIDLYSDVSHSCINFYFVVKEDVIFIFEAYFTFLFLKMHVYYLLIQ